MKARGCGEIPALCNEIIRFFAKQMKGKTFEKLLQNLFVE